MASINQLAQELEQQYAQCCLKITTALGELTVDVRPEYLLKLAHALHDDANFAFDMLVDVCGIDYLHYGLDDWQTQSATKTGFSRGCEREKYRDTVGQSNRFAVIYHLLSITHNHRIRLRVNIADHESLMVDSLVSIWPSANWFEREAFDLFGILFKGHPDLRRILTDYGFVGHPFRKDFPLIGKVEARYDATLGQVIYEDVSIEPRILEPKVIRHDNRYQIENLSDQPIEKR